MEALKKNNKGQPELFGYFLNRVVRKSFLINWKIILLFVSNFIVAAGCATTSGNYKQMQNQMHSVLQKQQEQKKANQKITDRLARMEKSLLELEERTKERFTQNAVTGSLANSKAPDSPVFFHSELIMLKKQQENLASSMDKVIRNGTENSRKIKEIDKKLLQMKKVIRRPDEEIHSTCKKKSPIPGVVPPKKENRTIPEDFRGYSPEQLYDQARITFNKQNYQLALDLFEEIIVEFPEHELVPDVFFWQGEAYYQLQDFANAEIKYNEIIKLFSECGKYPSALLKHGMSLLALDRRREGEARLINLIRLFPERAEAKRARIILENR